MSFSRFLSKNIVIINILMHSKEIQIDTRLKSINHNIYGALAHLKKPYNKNDVEKAIAVSGLQSFIKIQEDELFIGLVYTGKYIFIKTLTFDGKVNYTKLELENKTKIFEGDYVTLVQITKAEEILAEDANKNTAWWRKILYVYDSDVTLNIDEECKADVLFHVKSRIRKRVVFMSVLVIIAASGMILLSNETVRNFIYNLTPISKPKSDNC